MICSPYNPLGPAHAQALETRPNSSVRTRVGVFFATREGHTKRIAERIATDLRKERFDVDLHDVRHRLAFPLSAYAGVLLAASVHGGEHEGEMIHFVREHRSELDRIKTAFLSVTLSEAGAENIEATPADRARFAADVNRVFEKFFHETQWRPTRVKPVAGALLYTRYNFLLRLVMKGIARKAGGATDATRDYDYTDWAGLEAFVAEFACEMRNVTGQASVKRAASGVR
jgi:menaquinone-dependent protoporphyrinogen oxidase